MSQPIEISSVSQWNTTLRSATTAGQTVFVDFHAEWCGPCKAPPKYSQFAQEHPQAIFIRVDVDAQKNIAAKYQVTAMPTFFAIKSGKPVDSLRGADPNGLKAMITKHAEAAKVKGNKAFAAGDWTGAVEAYTEALKHAPKSPQLYGNRSLAYLKMGTPESRPKAMQDALFATNLDDQWGKGWTRVGDVMLAAAELDTMGSQEGLLKGLQGAEEAYQNAVDLLQATPSQLAEVQKKLQEVQDKIKLL
ncbi:thioredoxin-like protein [Hymenopellis radicata]|nr:thioredoxin-like protein [Hymenopellis radicata]